MEMIDQFRKRTNCSYEEAKMFLERNSGNFVDAMVDFERTHSKPNYTQKKSKFNEFMKKAYKTKVIVESNGTPVINISALLCGLFILFTLPVLPVIIISLVVALLFGCKFTIKKHTGDNVDINRVFTEATQAVKSQVDFQSTNELGKKTAE